VCECVTLVAYQFIRNVLRGHTPPHRTLLCGNVRLLAFDFTGTFAACSAHPGQVRARAQPRSFAQHSPRDS
jgi:hypothetical protein